MKKYIILSFFFIATIVSYVVIENQVEPEHSATVFFGIMTLFGLIVPKSYYYDDFEKEDN